MNNFKPFTLLFGLIFISALTCGQKKKNLAEQLGYPRDAKLLIVHADDIGLSHSVNSATIAAFEKKGINSGSIMVPCPWFPEIAEYAKEHQDLDLGIHLTLTAEWKNYKWDGVLPSIEIPSLINEDGYFYATTEEVARNADPKEVEKEIRAQIERAKAFGIKPTHLDTHMGSLVATPDLFQLYLKVGKEYNLPVFLPLNYLQAAAPEILEMTGQDHIFVDNFFMLFDGAPAEQWNESYKEIIENLKPGLNEVIVHVGINDDEMQAITIDHPDYGAAWRQRDFDYVISKEFRNLLEKNDIYLVTWKEIQKSLKSSSGNN
ncbi:MAG: polysaccharide deacetylase family protein [Bacteroidales bacterium]|nr:polysaccharide deacetylase family protein [Bacteroidales bacterium]